MTTVQKGNSIRFGSAKFEVGEDLDSLVDLGAMRGIGFEESWSEIQVKSDNAGIIIAGIREHQVTLKGDLMEIDIKNLALIRGGIDKLESITATPQTVLEEAVNLEGTRPTRLANKNGAGTSVTAVVVTNATGDTTYDEGTDYTLFTDSAGYTNISRVAAGTIASGMTVHVDYTYTPISAVKLLSGGISTFTPRVARVTNYDDQGKEFRITVFKATSANGLSISFPEADSEDPALTPIEMTGTPDTNRAIGEQLFEIYDEQGV